MSSKHKSVVWCGTCAAGAAAGSHTFVCEPQQVRAQLLQPPLAVHVPPTVQLLLWYVVAVIDAAGC
jgi:hypothetical protein